MNRLSPLAFAAAIFATGVSVMASAPIQAATIKVRYADLDLTSAQGRAALDARVRKAANTVCWLENETLRANDACRRASVADTASSVEHAIRAQHVQLASR